MKLRFHAKVHIASPITVSWFTIPPKKQREWWTFVAAITSPVVGWVDLKSLVREAIGETEWINREINDDYDENEENRVLLELNIDPSAPSARERDLSTLEDILKYLRIEDRDFLKELQKLATSPMININLFSVQGREYLGNGDWR